jgi:hypothetical protein
MSTPGVDVTVGHRLLSYLSSQMASPMATAAAVQARIGGPLPPELYHHPHPSSAAGMSSFNGRLPCQPPPGLSSPAAHGKYGRFSPTADANSNRISIKTSNSPPLMAGSSPPPSSVGFRGEELPPRPSSTPQTRSHLTVSITSGGIEAATFGSLLDQVSSCSNKNKSSIVPSSSSSSSSVIKPAPIRLSPNDPVWRPF